MVLQQDAEVVGREIGRLRLARSRLAGKQKRFIEQQGNIHGVHQVRIG